MSMLSVQADSLRKHAERLRKLANGHVNQGFPARQDLFESAVEMREAADTIESLRDRLQVDALGSEINGDTSDGYHTFNELYHHRAVLFSVCVAANSSKAWKARKHHDGTMYDGMFIVGIDTPEGQATYHYDLDQYWDMFWCRELESAPEWDGHTPGEAIERIASLRNVVMKGPRGRR